MKAKQINHDFIYKRIQTVTVKTSRKNEFLIDIESFRGSGRVFQWNSSLIKIQFSEAIFTLYTVGRLIDIR